MYGTLASHNERCKSPYLAGFDRLYCLKDLFHQSLETALGFDLWQICSSHHQIYLMEANLLCFQRSSRVLITSNSIKRPIHWKRFMLIVATKRSLEDSWYHITSARERFDFSEAHKYSNPKNAFNSALSSSLQYLFF